MANVTTSLFDGEFIASYDCIGEAQCRFATYYVEPPGEGDECIASTGGGNCRNVLAARSALAALQGRIAEELRRLSGEEEE